MAKTVKPKLQAAGGPQPLPPAELDRLIEEANVDAYNESEQATGFYTMIEENLTLPFQTVVLGVEVTVEAVDIAGDDRLMAVVRRGNSRQRLPLEELPLPNPPPAGAEWIAAYRRWVGGR